MSKKNSLNILDTVHIASPCNESWEGMLGDEQRRHCAKCVHTVTNLSEFTKNEAAKILQNRGANRLCVRYTMNQDGSIMYKERRGFAQRSLSFMTVLVATVLSVLGLSSNAVSEGTDTPQPAATVDSKMMLGSVVAASTPNPTPTMLPYRQGDIATMGLIAPKPTATPVQREGQVSVIKMGKVAPKSCKE